MEETRPTLASRESDLAHHVEGVAAIPRSAWSGDSEPDSAQAIKEESVLKRFKFAALVAAIAVGLALPAPAAFYTGSAISCDPGIGTVHIGGRLYSGVLVNPRDWHPAETPEWIAVQYRVFVYDEAVGQVQPYFQSEFTQKRLGEFLIDGTLVRSRLETGWAKEFFPAGWIYVQERVMKWNFDLGRWEHHFTGPVGQGWIRCLQLNAVTNNGEIAPAAAPSDAEWKAQRHPLNRTEEAGDGYTDYLSLPPGLQRQLLGD